MQDNLRKSVLLGLYSILLASVAAWQQAKAGPPVDGAYSRMFNSPTNLNGVVVCGWVSYYSATGSVEFLRLASDQLAWGKTPLPAGTGIQFKPDGTPFWCFLGRNYEIKGHLFNGGGHNWMTLFYPSGELKSGGLVHVEVIDGIPCEAAAQGMWGKHPRTYFYENGKLKSAQAAITFRHQGRVIEKGKRVELSPDGSIESIKDQQD